MIVDIDAYKINKEPTLYWLSNNRHYSYGQAIAVVANIYKVPNVVIAFWAGNLFDWPEEIVYTIIRLKEFYKYEGFKNIPPGSPDF